MKTRIKDFIKYLQNQTYTETEIDSEEDLKLLYKKWDLQEKKDMYFELQKELIAAGVNLSSPNQFRPSTSPSVPVANQNSFYFRKFTPEESSSIDWLEYKIQSRTLTVKHKSKSSSAHLYVFRVSAVKSDQVIYDTFFNTNSPVVSYGRELNIWKRHRYLTKDGD